MGKARNREKLIEALRGERDAIVRQVADLHAERIEWKSEREELRAMCDELAWMFEFVPYDIVECRGDKCREQWCASCMGDEYAEEYVSKARLKCDALRKKYNAMKSTDEDNGE